MLNNIGLYYPFIQFNMGRQEEWLKLATLYWDKLGRIALPDYNVRDTETVQQLMSDLGFIINFEPSQEEMNNIGSQFLTLLKTHHKELVTVYHTHMTGDLTSLSEYRQSWGQQWPSPLSMGRYWSPLPQLSPQPHLAYIFYSGRMTNELKDALVEAGLALPLKEAPHLIGVHPKLAFVYMEALAEAMATTQQLYPVTDDDLAHLAVEYEKKLKPQLDDIEKCLRSLGIETVLGAMNIRIALPALVTTGGAYLSQAHLGSINPILIGAGAVAFSIFPIIRDKGKEARDKVHASPAAYLFSIRENLSPSTLMNQITWRARSFVFRV